MQLSFPVGGQAGRQAGTKKETRRQERWRGGREPDMCCAVKVLLLILLWQDPPGQGEEGPRGPNDEAAAWGPPAGQGGKDRTQNLGAGGQAGRRRVRTRPPTPGRGQPRPGLALSPRSALGAVSSILALYDVSLSTTTVDVFSAAYAVLPIIQQCVFVVALHAHQEDIDRYHNSLQQKSANALWWIAWTGAICNFTWLSCGLLLSFNLPST
ncbi:hypothetical protein AXG93_333s1130 [Marchantia polymorpha subsp. ruderalis]|uniref:Uncharacterized protein n=1 Tax=Marchantia polymorpha subsp. ruderalis TaxID=1480154 RepID=A0A176VT62_MARPO|nr:hypothetical protein AXG93_333s1130 [Marchantia polymorpha subsp. ruderalis]